VLARAAGCADAAGLQWHIKDVQNEELHKRLLPAMARHAEAARVLLYYQK
jgi:hypothetical protein